MVFELDGLFLHTIAFQQHVFGQVTEHRRGRDFLIGLQVFGSLFVVEREFVVGGRLRGFKVNHCHVESPLFASELDGAVVVAQLTVRHGI